MIETDKSPVSDILAHYGVFGMKWGRRKSFIPPSDIKGPTRAGLRGYNSRKLNNKDLKKVIDRMKLEQDYKSLNAKGKSTEGKKYAETLIKSVGTTAVAATTGYAMKKLLDSVFKKYTKKAVTQVTSKAANQIAKSIL